MRPVLQRFGRNLASRRELVHKAGRKNRTSHLLSSGEGRMTVMVPPLSYLGRLKPALDERYASAGNARKRPAVPAVSVSLP